MAQIPDGKTPADKDLVQAKRLFEKLMIQFHQFLESKTLPENKSQGESNAETDFVMRLLVAANELDVLNAPEGTLGLITLLMREGFVMRDNNNRLEYKLKLLQQEINKLKTQITDLSRVGQRST
jgi:hypothetical protein